MERSEHPILGYVDRIAWVVMTSAIIAACSLPLATAWAGTDLVEAPALGTEPCLLFTYMDANRDGSISLAEARRIRGFELAFLAADQDRDGRLNHVEFARAQVMHDQARGANVILGDHLITTRVKGALRGEQALRSQDIGVETYNGQVILGGQVDSPARARQAVSISSGVNGVATVKSTLEVGFIKL